MNEVALPAIGDVHPGVISDESLRALCSYAEQGFLLYWFFQHQTLRDVLRLLRVKFTQPLMLEGKPYETLSVAALIDKARRTPEGALAWQHFAEDSRLQTLVREGLARIESLQAALRTSDDRLIRYELAKLDDGSHKADRFMLMGGSAAIQPQRFPPLRGHGDGFYDLLQRLLCFRPLESVAILGRVDGTVLRLACNEQLKRQADGAEFHVSALDIPGTWGVDAAFDEDGVLQRASLAPAWADGVLWFEEGIRPSELLVDDRKAPEGRSRKLQARGALFTLLPAKHGVEDVPGGMLWFQAREGFAVGVWPDAAEAAEWLQNQASDIDLSAMSA